MISVDKINKQIKELEKERKSELDSTKQDIMEYSIFDIIDCEIAVLRSLLKDARPS
jgi:hypothetical protein